MKSYSENNFQIVLDDNSGDIDAYYQWPFNRPENVQYVQWKKGGARTGLLSRKYTRHTCARKRPHRAVAFLRRDILRELGN